MASSMVGEISKVERGRNIYYKKKSIRDRPESVFKSATWFESVDVPQDVFEAALIKRTERNSRYLGEKKCRPICSNICAGYC